MGALAALLALSAAPPMTSEAAASPSLAVSYAGGRFEVAAEAAPLGEVLGAIIAAYPVEVVGLEARADDAVSFRAGGDPPERLFKRLLRRLGETNYALEFSGARLSRVSVMPESRAGAAVRPAAPRAAPEESGEMVSVVRVDRVIEGSQARSLGIQEGDFVMEYDGSRVLQPGQLIREVRDKTDREGVEMVIMRDGEPIRLGLKGGFIGVHIVPHRTDKESLFPHY